MSMQSYLRKLLEYDSFADESFKNMYQTKKVYRSSEPQELQNRQSQTAQDVIKLFNAMQDARMSELSKKFTTDNMSDEEIRRNPFAEKLSAA